MVHHSLNFVGWKVRKQVAADLRRIYAATTLDKAEIALGEFEQK
jgi:transposase-like protein